MSKHTNVLVTLDSNDLAFAIEEVKAAEVLQPAFELATLMDVQMAEEDAAKRLIDQRNLADQDIADRRATLAALKKDSEKAAQIVRDSVAHAAKAIMDSPSPEIAALRSAAGKKLGEVVNQVAFRALSKRQDFAELLAKMESLQGEIESKQAGLDLAIKKREELGEMVKVQLKKAGDVLRECRILEQKLGQ